MRIAPRTLLCASAYRVHVNVAGERFEELRELCTVTGDKGSLTIATASLAIDHAYQARMREALRRSGHPKRGPWSSRSAIRP